MEENNKTPVEITVVEEVPAKINWGRAANIAAIAIGVVAGYLYVSSKLSHDQEEEFTFTIEPEDVE
jgi:NADH:ubiquinone oxidoreductase subunit F (NADH-binding)